MSRTGGDKTKKRILKTAQALFSKNGFHATSVNQISEKAGVNKALIYYYFKSKNDLVISIFNIMLDQLGGLEQATLPQEEPRDIRSALKEEIEFLEDRKDIIAVMLMESLRARDRGTTLFKCAELVVNHEHGRPTSPARMAHEFFTGFIPLIIFVVLRDKWCDFFQCGKNQALDYFVEAFMASHVDSHTN